jgi:mannose-1-phosphate guanylyltransferase / phosphomannomutase
MKAVIMAGGEGTRLRPLTSNQPKPMVPIVGRPCMEHIVQLLGQHGFDDVIVTLAFMPQAIRSYFGDGEGHGLRLRYSVEDAPAGTAGSVRLAAAELDGALDETFLVISGDALCDVDLSALVRFHKEKGASVTIGLKSVDNPLEFGIVVIDEEGRIERFLEKPSWGEVFSDTINTGIYVLEPEVLRHVPEAEPYDFSKQLFPLLLEMGRPLYGCVLDGYWQDIGNIDQFRQANFDALDQKVELDIPGIRLRGHIWLGEGVEVDDLADIEGPAFLGNYCRIAPTASVGAYSALSSGVVLREGARVARSVVDQQTYFGRSVLVEGAFVGRSCDVRARARIHERVAIGDECTLGPESVVMPGVRIYPFKEVEAGAVVDRNVIWQSRATGLTGQPGLSGLVNVDLTPETAVRLGMAIGTALRRGSRLVASRSQQAACRLIKRALLVGVASTGVHVDDLQVLPAAVNRHLLKSLGLDAGIHVRTSTSDPEVVQIQVFEPPGVAASAALEKEMAKHFTRQEFRRASSGDLGELSFPARAAESYVNDLLRTLDREPIRRRGFRIVVDYCYSTASLILPLVLGALDVEAIGSHAHVTGRPPVSADASLEQSIAQTCRLVEAVGADLGAVIDQAGERLYLVDEQAREIPTDDALLLFVSLMAGDSRSGSIALPVTATSLVERIVDGSGLEVRRTPASLAALTRAATEEGTVFAGAAGGGFVFPTFLPAYDAMASLVNLLQLLAPIERPLSEIVAELPRSTLVHREVRCPWALKGTVMRVLTEQTKGREVDTLDGIKIFEDGGWSQVVPDPEQPLVHIYAEAESPEAAERLERELEQAVEAIIAGEEDGSG